MTERARILVVDDEVNIRSALATLLERAGHTVVVAGHPDEAVRELDREPCDIALLDLRMPGMGGMELLRRVKGRTPDTEIIVMTAFGSIDTAVEAMRAGAYDYLSKPIDRERLPILVEKALERRRLASENQQLKSRLEAQGGSAELIGRSPAMARVSELIDLVAAGNATVLVIGESGSGKELVARAIHRRGPRANRPFVGLNCGALPDHLQESELFGYEKGAFTGAVATKPGRFELADGGTLFLDEVGEMSLKGQIDFLRVLETQEFRRVGGTRLVKVDVRIIAATNRDLKNAVHKGSFREDLYYRLNVIPIHVPPLRERREDIPLLAETFLVMFAGVHQRTSQRLAPETIAKLEAYAWPGNVRELKNLAERLVVTVSDRVILPGHLPSEILDGLSPAGKGYGLAGRLLRDVEKDAIEQTLREVTSHREKAARILGISPRALQYKIKEYGIVVE